jgi:2-oxoisovalerate dehydrogenase E2 component (dihydrolipoyl transacylase)
MGSETAAAAQDGGAGKDFLLPDLGEGLTEAELVRWLVEVGQQIAVDQPVAEVETAKSVVEVPSPYAGVVLALHGTPGGTIDVGKPLMTVRAAAALHAAAETYREEERAESTAGSGNVLIGYGTSAAPVSRRRLRASGPPATGQQVTGAQVAGPQVTGRPDGPQAPLCISPLVRRLARESGIRLGDIPGSGPAGMVLRRDVETVAAACSAAAAGAAEPAGREPGAAASGPGTADTGAVDAGAVDAKTGLAVSSRAPVRGIRKATAENLARSRREIPEATVWVDVDATALVELRQDLRRREAESAPGLLALLARFVLAGLARYPELNTRLAEAADGTQEIVSFEGVNLGIAAQTERGLVVPSVRRADRLSARELDAEMRRLAEAARDGRAAPAELTSGTFTLNNYGVFGIDGSAAIINHPEVAILGIGRIVDRPWVVNGELAVRKVTELSLSFDHRVCDGASAGGFLRCVADAVENPGSLLADL